MRVMFDNYELNREEKKVLWNALDAYARIFQGQFSQLGHILCVNLTGKLKTSVVRQIVQLMDQAQILIFGNTAVSWRIACNLVCRSALVAHRLGLILEGERQQADALLQLKGFNGPAHDRLGGCPEDT